MHLTNFLKLSHVKTGVVIKLKGKNEIERRYWEEVQTFCKTPCFGAIDPKQGINKHLLEDIVKVVTEKAPLINSIVLGVSPTSQFNDTPKLYIISIKIVVILFIFYCSAYQNNSNYLPLIIALFFYLAGVKVNSIILLNYLGLSVFYNVL